MFFYYFDYFILLSFVGWLYESTAMTIYHKNWENRGFLFGPIIPIYGVGATVGAIFFNIMFPNLPIWQIFLIGVVASALLELPTSYILEYFFHTKWWDYSIAPLNFQGRISLLSSLGFGVAAIIIVYLINPLLLPFMNNVHPILIKAFAYITMFLFLIDITLTIISLVSKDHKFSDLTSSFDNWMLEIVEEIRLFNHKAFNVLPKPIKNFIKKYYFKIRNFIAQFFDENPYFKEKAEKESLKKAN